MKEKVRPVLFDTDVLIWYFRGLEAAAQLMEKTPYEQRYVSSLCIMELIQGCRNKRELKDITAFFSENFSHVVHCDGAISEKAISLLKTYALSHGLRTVDAIIAATAIASKASFATCNYRHFSMTDEMTLIRFNPIPKKR
jgi:hypothetical protein